MFRSNEKTLHHKRNHLEKWPYRIKTIARIYLPVWKKKKQSSGRNIIIIIDAHENLENSYVIELK